MYGIIGYVEIKYSKNGEWEMRFGEMMHGKKVYGVWYKGLV